MYLGFFLLFKMAPGERGKNKRTIEQVYLACA